MVELFLYKWVRKTHVHPQYQGDDCIAEETVCQDSKSLCLLIPYTKPWILKLEKQEAVVFPSVAEPPILMVDTQYLM